MRKSIAGNRTTYLRFVLAPRNPDSGVREGVFHIAYELRREGNLSEFEWNTLDALLNWFSENLERPNRFNRTKSKGYYRRSPKGISWLKSSAQEHVAKMREMALILNNHGHHVSTIKTAKPGYVVYEDEHQVVAEPFNDLRERI